MTEATRVERIHLGFEVGTGQAVSLPLRHMVVTGQTQEAGKTTTLEALIERAGVKAITFVTKRGEGSFKGARYIEPYFREEASWQFVEAILEASRGEKMRFERAWIIRASKGAKTLKDVHRNIKKFLADPKIRGINADVYLTLDAYLEAVVPQIDRVKWATSVQLEAGVNAMDMTALNVEMQHLVIRSTIDWVLHHETDTVVVVPEAWKFIPQGRGTPVKLGAEAYIRQGAGLRNYLWLDSQDIAGVEKIILKSVPVWILGVQRESNEVERTLDQIPAGIKKPKAEEVSTLGLGEFFACFGTTVTKTYVQALWMGEEDARAIARGGPREAIITRARMANPDLSEDDMDTRQELQRRVAEVADKDALIGRLVDEKRALTEEVHTLRNDLNSLTLRLRSLETGGSGLTREGGGGAVRAVPVSIGRGDGSVEHGSLREEVAGGGGGGIPATGGGWGGRGPIPEVLTNDDLFDAIKARLIAEAPGILKMLTVTPELEVTVVRETVQVDGKSLRGRVARLLAKGFFDEGVIQTHVRTELERHGAGVSDAKNLPRELDALVEMGFLTIEDGKDSKGRPRKLYLAVPGMKVNVIEK